MRVFVWVAQDKVTDSYHSGGGVVVFAMTVERAVALANEREGCHIAGPADYERNVDGGEERVFIFPDQGCC